MPLFEVAITLAPTKKEREDGKAETILMPITGVVAKDSQSAAISAVLQAQAKKPIEDADKNRMNVHVRPFV
jgi:hypothetical protein